MRVLLTHSNLLRNDPKQVRKMRPYPPLATLYAASRLRESDFEVELFDTTFEASLDDLPRRLRRFRPDLFVVVEDLFNFITKMCLTAMRDTALAMCAMAGEAGAVTLAAGPDVSHHPEPFLTGSVDYAVIGEPDTTLLELCDALREGRPAHTIDGVARLGEDGRVEVSGKRAPEKTLDTFPLPAWDLIDGDAYRERWIERHGFFSLNLVSSRGCPFCCRWCAKPIWGATYAQRSPESVAAEVALLKDRFDPDHLWFADDIFGHDLDWLATFDAELQARRSVIPYTIQIRPDLLSPEFVSHLNRSGCREVWMGMESGSQRILDAMGKGIPVETFHHAADWLREAGIRVSLFVQFGYPEETLDDIRSTIRAVRDLFPDDIGISVTYPLPGTELHDSVVAEIGAKTNWQDSDDLAVLFRGEYPTPFYKKLHHLLHTELELRHRLAAPGGAGSAETWEALRRLSDDWFELGRMEGQSCALKSGSLPKGDSAATDDPEADR